MTDLGSYLAEGTPAFFASAACRTDEVRQAVTAGLVDFFPDRPKPGKYKPTRAQAKALTICASCVVKDECLEYAVNHEPVLVGIWGGTTDPQRSAIRRNTA